MKIKLIPKYQNPSGPLTEDDFSQRIEDIKHPNGHYLNETVVTPSRTYTGTLPQEAMWELFQESLRNARRKNAQDNYTVQHNMSLTGAGIAKGVFEAASFPASFNPVIGSALGAIYGATAAKDMADNGLNWSNGLLLGLSTLPLARGTYKAALLVAKRFTYPWETVLNLTILGPNALLLHWSGESGPEVTYTSKLLKRLFNKTKSDIKSYIKGEEFKLRVMNTGLFTEDEYNLLLLEIKLELKKTKYLGRKSESGATNHTRGSRINQDQVESIYHLITAYPEHSKILHRANMWHEIWHSIGGIGEHWGSSYPLLYKLQRYNESINPIRLSNAMENVSNYSRITSKGGNVGAELNEKNWLTNEIILYPEEVRSRMLSTLDRLRSLGYDTKELINNPSKFSEWMNEILHKKILMPWDTNQLLKTYHIRDLSNYASKMLIPTGAAYLGNLLIDNNTNISE